MLSNHQVPIPGIPTVIIDYSCRGSSYIALKQKQLWSFIEDQSIQKNNFCLNHIKRKSERLWVGACSSIAISNFPRHKYLTRFSKLIRVGIVSELDTDWQKLILGRKLPTSDQNYSAKCNLCQVRRLTWKSAWNVESYKNIKVTCAYFPKLI